MLSKTSDETFNGRGTFDDFRSELENALSMTRLAARSDHERVGAVNIMVMLTQSDSTTFGTSDATRVGQKKHVRPSEGTRERRIQEQMLSGGIGPVAGPLLENDRCLQFHRHLQIPMQGHQLVRKPNRRMGLEKIDKLPATVQH